MRETNLAIFFHLGKSFLGMNFLETCPNLVEAVRLLNGPDLWLKDFLTQTEGMDMPDSRAAAKALLATIHGCFGNLAASLTAIPAGDAKAQVVDSTTISRFQAELQRFEEAIMRDCKQVDVFTVTPKGDRSTRILLTEAEKKFPANLIKVMPQGTIDDLQEAGKCLVFERPTACAFHVCRATEALMREFYEVLAGKTWSFPRRDWKNYTDQLTALNAPRRITDRLDEIRETERNAYAHPDATVPLDEAPIVYDLCTNVMFLMAKEIETIKARVTR